MNRNNIGPVDRILRIGAGLLLLTLMFVFEGGYRWIGLLGVVPLLTAFFGWCPAYSVFGIDTRALHRDTARRT